MFMFAATIIIRQSDLAKWLLILITQNKLYLMSWISVIYIHMTISGVYLAHGYLLRQFELDTLRWKSPPLVIDTGGMCDRSVRAVATEWLNHSYKSRSDIPMNMPRSDGKVFFMNSPKDRIAHYIIIHLLYFP